MTVRTLSPDDLRWYYTTHKRVIRARGKASASQCAHCGNTAREWATVHDTDGTDFYAHYIALCRKCHVAYDKTEYAGIGSAQRNQTECIHGHPLTVGHPNTRVTSAGKRACRTCARIRARQRRKNRREAR